jgi:hypothetical protein
MTNKSVLCLGIFDAIQSGGLFRGKNESGERWRRRKLRTGFDGNRRLGAR